MNYKLKKLSDLPEVAKSIIDSFPENRVFALYGQMGAGKTTLIKELCACLGIYENVTSPTFAIVNQYTTANQNSVFHFDFYRIKRLSEAYDLGYEDYFYSENYCFIEWPEMIEELLPQSFVKITITENDGCRELNIEKN